MEPLFARSLDGTLSLLFLPRELAEVLLELPAILDADDRPEVQSRRYQDPTDDDGDNAEWQRMMRGELAHLFAEARDVVAADLELLSRTLEHPTGARLDIPPEHTSAWISALQNARVSLGAAHGLDEEPADPAEVLAEPGPRAQAYLRMQVLGDLQGLLVECVAPGISEEGPAADDEDDTDADDEGEADDDETGGAAPPGDAP